MNYKEENEEETASEEEVVKKLCHVESLRQLT